MRAASLTLLCGMSLLGLNACNLQGLDPTSGGSSSVDSQHMQIQTPNGMAVIAKSEVTDVQVRLYASSQSFDFEGGNAQTLIGPIEFNAPLSETDTGPATGTFTMTYKVGTQEGSETYYIVTGSRGQFVEDASNSNIQYHATVPLDSHWVGQ